MGQKPSKSITIQQTSPIFTIPEDLFTLIALLMDTKSQLEFAYTCKIVHTYHKRKCKEETAAFLSNLTSDCYPTYLLERWLSKSGWATERVTLKEISTDSLRDNSYPIKALCLEDSVESIPELNCESIEALILVSSIWEDSPSTSLSSLRKFPNLKILGFISTSIDEDMVSVISILPLLKVISLNCCEITYDHLSRILEACTTLEEIELLYPSYFDTTYIMFPPQVERLHIRKFHGSTQIDISRCTQLQFL
jgi:hypothetical protein